MSNRNVQFLFYTSGLRVRLHRSVRELEAQNDRHTPPKHIWQEIETSNDLQTSPHCNASYPRDGPLTFTLNFIPCWITQISLGRTNILWIICNEYQDWICLSLIWIPTFQTLLWCRARPVEEQWENLHHCCTWPGCSWSCYTCTRELRFRAWSCCHPLL